MNNLELPALRGHVKVACNKYPQATRINVRDFCKIQKNLIMSFVQWTVDGIAQCTTTSAAPQLAVYVQNGPIFNLTLFDRKVVHCDSLIPSQGNAHRISRHALSLFNCDWFEEY